MAEEETAGIAIRDFPGLVLDVDTLELPPGASDDQLNATSSDAGSLRSRKGFLKVAFEGE